ncbi:hypothetical protein R3P38DRAFT_3172075 [Favolaschia claudopus]|uniref:Uncharacterized protein n=1 Tax=Favolaschia claudopus TaxID=2862362 RepID=A0AAW0DL04_9AGAR
MRLGSPISLPSTPRLLSDPYKSAYQRRRSKSMGAESPLLLMRDSTLLLAELCEQASKTSAIEQWSPAQVWSPPNAEQLQRLISELENIRLSESTSGCLERLFACQNIGISALYDISTFYIPPFYISTFYIPPFYISTFYISTYILEVCLDDILKICGDLPDLPASNPTPSVNTQASQPRARRPNKCTRSAQDLHSKAHCPHGFKRIPVCPHGFKRFTACPHGFRLASICPHGYAQVASAMHGPVQTTSCRPRYEDSIFEKAVKLFM